MTERREGGGGGLRGGGGGAGGEGGGGFIGRLHVALSRRSAKVTTHVPVRGQRLAYREAPAADPAAGCVSLRASPASLLCPRWLG